MKHDLELVITTQAEIDPHGIWSYIARDYPERADRFIDKIYNQCYLLCSSPLMGRQREDLQEGLRSFPFRRYNIFHRITDEHAIILRVLSAYRDLGPIWNS